MKMASWRSLLLSHRLQFHGRNATLIFDIYSTLCAAFWPQPSFFSLLFFIVWQSNVRIVTAHADSKNLDITLEDKTPNGEKIRIRTYLYCFCIESFKYTLCTLRKILCIMHAWQNFLNTKAQRKSVSVMITGLSLELSITYIF